MKVTLIDHTENAIEKLLYTKLTRLTQGEDRWNTICTMSPEERMTELGKMAQTIPSSWEFVNYTFDIQGVTRAFTHQFVRTRTGSYAQQTMRVLDMEDWDYSFGPTIESHGERKGAVAALISTTKNTYKWLLKKGAAIEDARGILPTNIHTNIIAQFSLRTLADMNRSRGGQRTQGEYRDVLLAMNSEVYKVHPWAESFIEPDTLEPVKKLEEIISFLKRQGKITPQAATDAFKNLDLIRKNL